MNPRQTNESLNAEASASEGRAFRFILWLFVIVIFVILALSILDYVGLQISMVLGFGWIAFLFRVIPRISWNWDLVGMAVVCLAGLLGVAHAFLRWLTGEIFSAQGKSWSWPWRWTWCGAAGMGILFLVGMAIGGIFHQAAWIAASPESLSDMKSRTPMATDIRQFHLALQMALSDFNGNLEPVRRELRNSKNRYYPARANQAAPAERVACLLLIDSHGQCFGGILFQRGKSQDGSNELFYWCHEEDAWLSTNELDSLLQKHRGRVVAL